LTIHKHKNELLLIALLLSLFLIGQINPSNNKIVASGNVGTQVSGTLASNTTWTTANSPYLITNTIQIPENINLTIEPGVTVTIQSPATTMFLINGVIQAHGNLTNKIIFDGNGNSSFFKTNHPVAQGFADLDYCVIRDGQSAFWFDNTGFFNLTNSELSNLSEYSYLWYPSQETFIEYNSFTNTAGIKIGTDDYSSNSSGNVYVRYNLFYGNQGFILNNYASYGGFSKTIVNNNSFTNTEGIILEVEKTSTTADMDASQNYWGTTNTTIIDLMIYDKNDDDSCYSFINYLPLLDVPNPDTPVVPTPTPSPTPLETSTPTSTNAPEPTSVPTNTVTPSASPTPSTEPSATSDPTETSSTSSTPDQASNPTNTISNPTTNPNETINNANPSTRVAIPEFSLLSVVLVLFAAGSISIIMLKTKNSKSDKKLNKQESIGINR
jgi:hypothetical protein